jgi:hypothetical protein
MLSHHDLTDIQFFKIWTQKNKTKCDYLLDLLFEKKFDFSLNAFINIREVCGNINDNHEYDNIHNNSVFLACAHLLKNKHINSFNKCIELLENAPFNMEHFDLILNILENKTCMEPQI